MPEYKITIETDGSIITSPGEETIKEALEREGYYFPNNCGGKGKCLGCRVKFISHPPEMTELEQKLLDPHSAERMACQHRLTSDIQISVQGYEAWDNLKALSDFRIECGGTGYGIAVDLGTTLVAVYLADLRNGSVIAQKSFVNPQLPFGSDVMSRLESMRDVEKRRRMVDLIRKRVGSVILSALRDSNIDVNDVNSLFLAGNSVMTQIWLGYEDTGLSRVPFTSILEGRGSIAFEPALVGLPDSCRCRIVPVLRGFIGGDTTAAILATDLDVSIPGSDNHRETGNRLLFDLGTNGEIVLSANGRLRAASTAAGPAFEGVGMLAGMPAITGAIEGFTETGEPRVIGGVKPLGLCGSGYISAISLLLREGIISSSGLMKEDREGERRWSFGSEANLPPFIVQDDVRRFQLAKGAVAAGVEILCLEAGIVSDDLDEIILTGSFGSRIDLQAARDIGLIPDTNLDRVSLIENAAGRGALLCLSEDSMIERAEELQRTVDVINLGERDDFQDRFVENMTLGRCHARENGHPD